MGADLRSRGSLRFLVFAPAHHPSPSSMAPTIATNRPAFISYR
jgi:hypothetical protein